MSEKDKLMRFNEWLDQGVMEGFCDTPVCLTHDSVSYSKEEEQELDNGNDPCIIGVRLRNMRLLITVKGTLDIKTRPIRLFKIGSWAPSIGKTDRKFIQVDEKQYVTVIDKIASYRIAEYKGFKVTAVVQSSGNASLLAGIDGLNYELAAVEFAGLPTQRTARFDKRGLKADLVFRVEVANR